VREASGPVMGTTAHVAVAGGTPDLPARALRRLADLERRWSRFRDDSELSKVNAAAGTPCVVSSDTLLLVELLCRAWRESNGRFDPTQLDALVALGYSGSFPEHLDTARASAAVEPAVGCAGVRVDRGSRLVWLPPGLQLDPGGLGKGLAADLVAHELRAAGADGVLVNVGGDLAVSGAPDSGGPWHVRIEHPDDPNESVADIVCCDGGIATTSRRRRAWTLADGTAAHHVLDPADGRPSRVPWVSATVIADTAWQAEVGAKVAFLDGALRRAHGVHAAVLVHGDGTVQQCFDDQSHIVRVREEVAS
jgi:thiamine biosynthesis lipoprotein